MPPLKGMSSNLCAILAFSESPKLLMCDPLILPQPMSLSHFLTLHLTAIALLSLHMNPFQN